MEWKKIAVNGVEWEVRAVSTGLPAGDDEELLEFRPGVETLPARRVTVKAGSLDGMGEAELMSAFSRALPIGGDHYGRPGKRMPDAN